MRRFLAVVLVAVAVAGNRVSAIKEETRYLAGTGSPGQADRPSFEAVFRAYEGGDYDAITRALKTRQDLLVLQQEALRAAKDDKRAWTPALPAFLLELAIDAQAHDWWDFEPLLVAARTVAVARPSLPGQNALADRFEITLHRTAVAFMTAANLEGAARQYLDALRTRVVPTEAPGPPHLVDPRVALARADVDEAEVDVMYWPVLSAAAPGTPVRDPALRQRIAAAVTAFETAAALPSVAAEAHVHEGFLLCELGEPAQALDVLDRGDATDDLTLQYWTALFRGRALAALSKPDEAEAAFRHAAALYPAAQTPAIALVPLLLKQNRMDEALEWSTVARRQGSAALDPWWQYRSGDLRFVPGWIRELRAAWRSK